MRERWIFKELGEVCFYPTKRLPLTEISAQQYVGVETLIKDKGGVSFSDELPNADTVIEYKKDDILIGNIRPYLRKIWKADRNGGASGDIVNIRVLPNYKEILNPDYLYNVLSSDKFFDYDNSNTHGAKMPRGDRRAIAKYIIPIPPIHIQQSIVAELNKIKELIGLKNSQLSDMDSLLQSKFHDIFGDPVENDKEWEIKNLSEISSLICNGNTPKGGSEVYVDDGILFLRSQNVWKNRIEFDDVAYIDEATNQKLRKSILMHNDLLITKTGRFNTENSSLGRTALFEGEDGTANINGHVYLVRLKKGMIHKFVLYIFISNSYRELIRRTCVGGIDKRQLNKDHIEDFPIIFPPIELQKKYVTIVEKIEKQKQQICSTIKDLEMMLASRMQYWFE